MERVYLGQHSMLKPGNISQVDASAYDSQKEGQVWTNN